jgi:hypothetical protein
VRTEQAHVFSPPARHPGSAVSRLRRARLHQQR